jgi:hypothetical protein
MKLRRLVFSRVGILVCCALALGGGVLARYLLRSAPAAHVQIVLASDGSLLVAGVPGRSMRTRIQNPTIWDGQAKTSKYLVDWLRNAAYAEKRGGTFDGAATVIVDDHASFLMAKMLIASTRAIYPTVGYLNGPVDLLPVQHGADGYKDPASYIKDCSAIPMPAGCVGELHPKVEGSPKPLQQ